MPIDASIALGVKPVQLEDPTNALAKVLQVRGLQQQQQLGQMQADEYRTGVERKNKLYGVLAQDYAAPEARESALMKSGFADEAMKFGKDRRDSAKADADRQKVELESHLKRFELAGQIMSGVNDQATWDIARQQTAQAFGPEAAAQMPAQYDPALIEQKRQQAMSVKEQVEAKYRALTQAETVTHNRNTEGLTAQGQALTMRGQDLTAGMASQRLSFDQQKDAADRAVAGGGAKMTEDQGKATGWLVQAENAWKNMQKVGLDKEGNVTSAAKPGFNDAIAAIPSFGATGGLANAMRGADRQKFMQASSSLSEALLRAATGAGITKDEALQKVQELTPAFGEEKETTKQKMAAIPLYIEALKVRAGPGAAKAAAIKPAAAPAAASALPAGWKVQAR